MKAKLQSPYKLLSGRNETVVNFPIDRRPMVRDMVIPFNPQSPIQEEIRSCFAQASSAFNTITDAQRLIWHQYAQRIKKMNSLGQEYSMPDKSLFVQVNLYRRFKAYEIENECPVYESTGIITDVTDCGILGTKFKGNIHSTGIPAFHLFETSNALPGLQRQARKNEIFMVSNTLAYNIMGGFGEITPFEFEISECKFNKQVNDRICIQITPLNNGLVSGIKFMKNVILTEILPETATLSGALTGDLQLLSDWGVSIDIQNNDPLEIIQTILPENNQSSWLSMQLSAGTYNIIVNKGSYSTVAPESYLLQELSPPVNIENLDFNFTA